jgi:fused signal recognition particle receptor
MSENGVSTGRPSLFARLKQGLQKSASALSNSLTGLFTKKRLDAETVQSLEDALIKADLGALLAHRLTAEFAAGRYDKEIAENEIRALLAASIAKVLAKSAVPFAADPGNKPYVVLVAGVNGTGKTTTIGKLAAKLAGQNKRVLIAACDTFRAAAIEQLQIWGQRAGAEVIAGAPGADAAGLAYDALEKARARGADVLLIDTAGRLQNKAGLMAELQKIARVIKKLDATAPHACLLVLDATTGQNAISQVEAFRAAVPLTGLVMTKLDGTAKGGILVALADRFGLPIHYIGVGEAIGDLQPFDAESFAKALTGAD